MANILHQLITVDKVARIKLSHVQALKPASPSKKKAPKTKQAGPKPR
jgi:hypothetical protein